MYRTKKIQGDVERNQKFNNIESNGRVIDLLYFSYLILEVLLTSRRITVTTAETTLDHHACSTLTGLYHVKLLRLLAQDHC